MIIVADAGPILHLHWIGCSSWGLPQQSIHVVEQVWIEIAKHAPESLDDPRFVRTRPPASYPFDRQRFSLHDGEAAAIAVALDHPGALLSGSGTSIMLPLLKSRWTTPARCAAASAAVICWTSGRAWSGATRSSAVATAGDSGDDAGMASITLDELLKLSPEERVVIAEALWDSVLDSPEASELLPLLPEQVAELKRRLTDHDRDPSTALPWAEVRRSLLGPE